MAKIIVIVKGGVVQAVHSDTESLNVEVLDYDNYEQEDRLEYRLDMERLMEEAKALKQIY